MEKPYVISGEFDLSGNSQRDIIQLNKLEQVRGSLIDDLEGMGKSVAWVPGEAIARGMNKYLDQSRLPVISLDEVYVPSPDGKIGLSRGINSNLDDIGYVPRVGYGSVQGQFDAIAARNSEIQLADDVIFSGEMMTWVVSEFEKRCVRVGRVVCGVAIGEGIAALDDIGIPVESVYSFDDVEDELCERDLFVTRGSGRRISQDQGNALYFDDQNGRPEQWASIPARYVERFCANSLQRSLELLRPEVTIDAIGAFYGYETTGRAADVLRARLERGSRNA